MRAKIKKTGIALSLSWSLYILLSFSPGQVLAQHEDPVSLPILFRTDSTLPVQLRYSNKHIKRNTDDSTYLQSGIWFREGKLWDSLPVRLRARGNFRRKTCYYVPLKLNFKKSVSRNTLFEGSEKLKLVLPCLLDRRSGDFVLKEYMAYKMYEVVAPYHFKTRLVEISFFDNRGRREVEHHFYGFLLEDIDLLVQRYGGKEINRYIHPLQHDAVASVRNAIFQYMIANTDFSTRQLHNQKLLFAEKRIIPLPYDFDMSGFVNAPYAMVTNVQNLSGSITQVTDRIYKGYERDRSVLYQVRDEYIQKKSLLLQKLTDLEASFSDSAQYREARAFLLSFFDIIEDDKKFEKEILNRLRSR